MRLRVFAITFVLVCSVLLWGTAAWSDTFRLSDGTVVICKIIEETDTHYVIANSYGTFTVKKKSVKEYYVTKSYKDDVKIQKKMNLQVDEENVKKNIEEGLKKKKEKEAADRKKKGEGKPPITIGARNPDWFFGRIGLTVAYYGMVTPRLMRRIPKEDCRGAFRRLRTDIFRRNERGGVSGPRP